MGYDLWSITFLSGSVVVKAASAELAVKRIAERSGISEWILTSNQLRVLHCPMPFPGVIGVMITYLVGSRFEGRGQTGATHFLEHMMFK